MRVRVRSAANFYFTCGVVPEGATLIHNYSEVIISSYEIKILFLVMKTVLIIRVKQSEK